MNQLWLVLSFALSLWSPPAAAGAPSPARGPAEMRGANEGYARQVLRPTGGLELFGVLEARVPQGGPSRRDGGPPDRYVGARPPLSERARDSSRSLRPPDPSRGTPVPLCERLPYHATAPPSSR